MLNIRIIVHIQLLFIATVYSNDILYQTKTTGNLKNIIFSYLLAYDDFRSCKHVLQYGPLWTGILWLPLQWRHNNRDGASIHRRLRCLLNRLFRQGQRKHQNTASLAFDRGIHRWPVNSPRKGLGTRKMLPFDDVIMGWLLVEFLCKGLQMQSFNDVSVLSQHSIGWHNEAHVMAYDVSLLWRHVIVSQVRVQFGLLRTLSEHFCTGWKRLRQLPRIRSCRNPGVHLCPFDNGPVGTSLHGVRNVDLEWCSFVVHDGGAGGTRYWGTKVTSHERHEVSDHR